MPESSCLIELMNQGLQINNEWDLNSDLKEARGKKLVIMETGQHLITNKGNKLFNIFPVYVKELYGDGFFYAPIKLLDDIDYYFLIIQNGIIKSETDCVISKKMLDFFLESHDKSIYKNLDVIILNDSKIIKIRDAYLQNKNKYKHWLRNVGISILSAVLITALSLLYYILIL